MRLLTLGLAALLLLVNLQLWFGDNGMGRVVELAGLLRTQKAENDAARSRNERLASEVRDLQEGLEMVEEKARLELGMVKPDEILVQVKPRR
jgi:cell division protein FtsB